jgi:site-specific DNA recombinase
MKQNVAYLRVSTESQTEKYGLDLQRQKIEDYAQARGIVIGRWYVDGGYSGAKMERPQVQELLSDARNGWIENVYIYKLDRMSRDTVDTLKLLYDVLPLYDVKLVSMTEEIRTETPMDRAMLTMNAAMNQYERETIYMRTRAGMAERIKRGYWMGGGKTPYGYYYDRNDGILHIEKEEAENVREVFRLYINGMSSRNIALQLNLCNDRLVDGILRRKTYIGLIPYKGEFYKGLHEPIIDIETFEKTQRCIEKRSKTSFIKHNNALTGLCYCGICGARMRYQKWGNYYKLVCYSHYQKSAKEYLKRANDCDNLVNAELIEAEVEDCFKRFTISLDEMQCKQMSESERVESAVARCNNKLKRLYSIYGEGDDDNLLELISEEKQKLSQLKEQLAELQKKEQAQNDLPNRLADIKRVADVWDTLTEQEKNKILKECVERVTINGDDVEIRFIV